jgi:hypothetical protein
MAVLWIGGVFLALDGIQVPPIVLDLLCGNVPFCNANGLPKTYRWRSVSATEGDQ